VAETNSEAAPPTVQQAAISAAGALGPSLEQVARDARVLAAARTDLAKQLAAKEIGQAADTDPEVASQLAAAITALSGASVAAAAWHRDLSAASAWWEACLADLARRHPEAATNA
jgi:hypothetical protein